MHHWFTVKLRSKYRPFLQPYLMQSWADVAPRLPKIASAVAVERFLPLCYSRPYIAPAPRATYVQNTCSVHAVYAQHMCSILCNMAGANFFAADATHRCPWRRATRTLDILCRKPRTLVGLKSRPLLLWLMNESLRSPRFATHWPQAHALTHLKRPIRSRRA